MKVINEQSVKKCTNCKHVFELSMFFCKRKVERKQCSSCRHKKNKSMQNWTKKFRFNPVLCVVCGTKKPNGYTNKVCRKCLDLRKKTPSSQRRKQNGYCSFCGIKIPPGTNTNNCKSCLKRVNQRRILRLDAPTVLNYNEKKCMQCYRILHENEFSGENITCMSCRNKSIRAYQKKYKFILKHKFQGGCAICGIQKWYLLSFDHINPKHKSGIVGQLWAKEKIQEEIEKCRLLCANCHRIHSKNQRKENPLKMTYGAIKQRNRVQKKQLYVNNIKISKGCESCGYTNAEYPETLDFDHIDRSTKHRAVSQMLPRNNSYKAIDAEIAKCRVLCANCHIERTITQLGYYTYIGDDLIERDEPLESKLTEKKFID